MALKISLTPQDALLIADIQNDFLPEGALEIRGSEEILPILESYVRRFQGCGLPIFLTRDWHPPDHCSFVSRGGVWPVHCVAGSPGSLPPTSFPTPDLAVIIYKATDRTQEAYSAFQNTSLDRQSRDLPVRRLFVGGLVLHPAFSQGRSNEGVRCLSVDGRHQGSQSSA